MSKSKSKSKIALIIVDVQNDFLPATQHSTASHRPTDGSLAVPQGDQVIPTIQTILAKEWHDVWDVVVASQDYHPPRHISFASRHGKDPFTDFQVTDARSRTYMQTMWPDHCVQGTTGVEIDQELEKSLDVWRGMGRVKIVRKACHIDIEAYSAFEGYLSSAANPEPPSEYDPSSSRNAEMTAYLREQGVGKVVITGLATDFCVRQTTLDAIAAGFETALLVPCVRAVYADKAEGVFEEIEGRGGKIRGRDERGWEGALSDWLQE